MRVAIHQPEHFPYMGFFQKMQACDLFIILDDVKYKKNNFQNRNKFLNSSGVDEWFTVPVEKKATSKLIKDVVVSNDSSWRRKLLAKIQQNMKVDVSEIYDSSRLIDINMKSICWSMNHLKINTPFIFSSNLFVDGSKSELLANMVRMVGGTTYISGSGGKDYLKMEYFNGIDVEFFEPDIPNYYSVLYNISVGDF